MGNSLDQLEMHRKPTNAMLLGRAVQQEAGALDATRRPAHCFSAGGLHRWRPALR
jgi:hypothetical protein